MADMSEETQERVSANPARSPLEASSRSRSGSVEIRAATGVEEAKRQIRRTQESAVQLVARRLVSLRNRMITLVWRGHAREGVAEAAELEEATVMLPEEAERLSRRAHLVEWAEAARKEALSNHPQPGILAAYSLYPEKLSRDEIWVTEEHLAMCERCRVQVEDTQSRADYFRRQKTTHGDCS